MAARSYRPAGVSLLNELLQPIAVAAGSGRLPCYCFA